MLSHHCLFISRFVLTRSQSPYVLCNTLFVCFRFHRFTDASLSHTSLTDLMLIFPDLAIVPVTAIPEHIPPSSDRYDVIWFGAPPLGPPPEIIISSSFVDTTQMWYPTSNNNDPSVAMIIYLGSVGSKSAGNINWGIFPTCRRTCFGSEWKESPISDW
jgi:hypothetical protein